MRKDNDVLLSVLLPAFNAQNFVGEAIQSILKQTFGNFELLVADDGSGDNTRAIIDNYASLDSRIGTFHNAKNEGKTATVISLFRKARGRFITIHDADDVSLPHRFERQILAFEKDPELVLCGTSFITVDAKGFVLEKTKMPSSYDFIYQHILSASQFHGPTMIIRKSVLEELGEIYRPYFRDNYEDTDLAARIIDKYKGYNLEEYLYVYRILQTSLCRRRVDVRNRNLYKVVSYLTVERRNTGFDALMENRNDQADHYLAQATAHYNNDPALIHREAAAYFLYWQLYSEAIKEAVKGIIKRPFDFINLRTLLYVLSKRLLTSRSDVKEHYTKVL